MIVDLCGGWLADRTGKSEGVVRLLGGGLTRGTDWKRERNDQGTESIQIHRKWP